MNMLAELKHTVDFSVDDKGNYIDFSVNLAWRGWIARSEIL